MNRYIERIDTEYWELAREGTKRGLELERLSGKSFSDRELLSYALERAMPHLIKEEETCPVSVLFKNLSDLAEDKSINMTRCSIWPKSYVAHCSDWPEGFRIVLENSVWRLSPKSISPVSFGCFISTAGPGEKDHWMGIHSIVIPELHKAVMAVDQTIPALMKVVSRERLLFAKEEMVRILEQTTESAKVLTTTNVPEDEFSLEIINHR